MKRLVPLLALAALLALPQAASSQGLSSYMQGNFVVKGGLSYMALFEDVGGGNDLYYFGVEKALGESSHFTATADMQLYSGGGTFFYMGAVGARYYLSDAMKGLHAGAWALYDDATSAFGAGTRLGYQIPLGRFHIDLGGGPAYLTGSGGGGALFMGTASVGFEFGRAATSE